MTLFEPELITIVEGPPPDFQMVGEAWPFSLWEGRAPQAVALTQMRTFNGAAMMDRCLRAWSAARPVMLDFQQMDGLRRKAEVLAARATSVDEGDVLSLWVVLPIDEVTGGLARDSGDVDPDDLDDTDDPALDF